ncbi:thiamine pyrophosphate-binding protein [Solicola gregarius]|uniref:Thiamine pyrophosphate-binding protein n=1 Tax=Solicola gregarius TaxID=2908642 RepID=A0AA46TFJ0_9ACTN|nr:thiamine pyrophosphate-binding protein [Solicola gregarius]UYM04300.1 thiamine pyrophosphate-binding protein [Solicola gregarius]
MDVAEAVGRALAAAGVEQAFGVVGSGNFAVTNAIVAGGATFVAARHEGGAATMADAYARTSGQVAAVTVHQGCGLTNALTGITEAAKSRTPLVVVAAEATAPRSNFYVDQPALAAAVGARSMRIDDAATAADTAVRAVATALHERRTVLLNLPLGVQTEAAPDRPAPPLPSAPAPVAPDAADVRRLADALQRAERPVFIAGRGARSDAARTALESLAEACGALLATSAVAKGLFRNHPWALDVSGGFASPLAAELITGADLVVGWGTALNMWTTRHGRLIGDDAFLVQVDDDPDALGAHREIGLGVVGDVAATAATVSEQLAGPPRDGYRSDDVGAALAERGDWLHTAYDDSGTDERIDPRTLTAALDAMLPAERVVGVDSGNFMGYPSMFLRVPDERGFCFTQAYQSIGLGLATAIGAALAQPDRLPVAAVGDGGLLMSAAELETVVRLRLPMVVIAYDDAAYGAEVHHFGPSGADLETVRFPDTDLAAIARGYGYEALTVSRAADLDPVADWLAGPRTSPLLIDAKVTTEQPSWWLEEAFRGH